MSLLERLALVDILPKVNWFALISWLFDFLALNFVNKLQINYCHHYYNADLSKMFYFLH